MLDDLHKQLLYDLLSPFYQSKQNQNKESYENLAEHSFLKALAFCMENQGSLNEEDLVELGSLYKNLEDRIEDEDLMMDSLILSKNPERSGRKETDLRPFVRRILNAHNESIKNT